MKVYVLTYLVDEQGDTLCGVTTSAEKSEAWERLGSDYFSESIEMECVKLFGKEIELCLKAMK